MGARAGSGGGFVVRPIGGGSPIRVTDRTWLLKPSPPTAFSFVDLVRGCQYAARLMRPRAICICRDPGVCNVVGNALAGAGVEVEHHEAVPAETSEVALFVVDQASRQTIGEDLRELGAPVV